MEQQQASSCGGVAEADEKRIRVQSAISQFKMMKGALIPILHEIQDLYGYLPEPVLQMVAAELNLPMSEIYGVASFYHFFSLTPKGENVVHLCLGTACYIKGAQAVLDRLSTELKVPVQGTTEDNKFTLEATRCLGACGLAPVMTIGEKVHGRLTPNTIPKILKGI
ncbi:NADH-quinone oxidoreductase subunit NuoE [Paenibacillus sp. NFR01]|uniref:NADH-quinone oxidoreductase subunit NuoE n=1 Tax=Paenibacillus sp. NFR01 TaxID=1566279 RepID=UPI0008D64851|nr:NADH-quinone oxidoreductase subunit NuoE [Paenibacillus sp. NFR01]SET26496.1 NADH-quinone oxidoreductase subunit E [Paenibacillus sp. NFR01]